MGSTREWEAILGSGDGELGGSVGLYVRVVMGCGRECAALCGSGDGESEGVWGYVWEW
jgi:hypothetical protein